MWHDESTVYPTNKTIGRRAVWVEWRGERPFYFALSAFVEDETPTIRRVRSSRKRGFFYFLSGGSPARRARLLKRMLARGLKAEIT